MDFDMLFLAGKENSTKALIIRSLAVMKESTNVQIQRVIRKEFNKKISYQAIRQALTELLKDNILEKNKKLYSIKNSWILELKSTVELLENSLKNKSKIIKLDKQTSQVNLKNLYELGHFILFGLEDQYFQVSENEELLFQLEHLWIPFSDTYKRERLKQIFQKHKTTAIIKNKTMMDKILSLWYKKNNKVKLGNKFKTPCDYIILGNTVVQIFMDKKLKEHMNRVYNFRGLLKTDFLKQLHDMTYNEYGIQLIITRNKKIAENIRENIKTYITK